MAQTTQTNNDAVIDIVKRKLITYGSRIVMEHVNTQYRLHSHHAYYPGGSKQQQVTCFSSHDANDWWIVKPAHANPNSLKLFQQPVTNGDIIRLQHYNTGCYLHSHANVKSAVTSQQEVTGFWSHDSNNNWKISFKNTKANVWNRGDKINLIHSNSNVTLHSHNHFYPDWGFKQQEVTGYASRDTNDDWFVSKVEKDQYF